jgi:hypothetical protein
VTINSKTRSSPMCAGEKHRNCLHQLLQCLRHPSLCVSLLVELWLDLNSQGPSLTPTVNERKIQETVLHKLETSVLIYSVFFFPIWSKLLTVAWGSIWRRTSNRINCRVDQKRLALEILIKKYIDQYGSIKYLPWGFSFGWGTVQSGISFTIIWQSTSLLGSGRLRRWKLMVPDLS